MGVATFIRVFLALGFYFASCPFMLFGFSRFVVLFRNSAFSLQSCTYVILSTICPWIYQYLIINNYYSFLYFVAVVINYVHTLSIP